MKVFPVLLLFGAAFAHADVYKSTDASGVVLFSDHPSEGAKKLEIPPAPPVPSKATIEMQDEPAPVPADKVGEERKTLENRLNSETGELDKSRKALKAAQETISGAERNSQADIDRAAVLEDEIARREKAVEALRKRISDLK